MIQRTTEFNFKSHRGACLRTAAIAALLWLAGASDASAISLTMSQVGGTAIDGRGRVGDTIDIAVDFLIGEDEVTLGTYAGLKWDAEGGNVLDAVSAVKSPGGFLGPYRLSPMTSRFVLAENFDPADARYFEDGSGFYDQFVGTTYLTGLGLFAPVIDDEELYREIIENGLPGPASIRMGVVTFRLTEPGTTTLGFDLDPDSPFQSGVTAPRGIVYDAGDIQFTDIPITAVGFSALQIEVIPEPSTAILLGGGLVLLAQRRREHRARS